MGGGGGVEVEAGDISVGMGIFSALFCLASTRPFEC